MRSVFHSSVGIIISRDPGSWLLKQRKELCQKNTKQKITKLTNKNKIKKKTHKQKQKQKQNKKHIRLITTHN